ADRIFRTWSVEAGQEEERAITDVAVAVLGDRLHKGRDCLPGSGPAHRPRSVGARGVIEIAELVDSGLELGGGDGARSGGFLGLRKFSTTEDPEDTEDQPGLKPSCPR